MIDRMSTLMRYGLFAAGLPVLFFHLGELLYRAGVTSYGSWFDFLPLQFWDLGLWGLASRYCIYGTCMSKKGGTMDP